MNALKKSQKIILLFIFIVGVVITLFLVKQQQDLRERAVQTDISAVTVCSTDGLVNINVSFTNTSTSIVNVAAKDTQTGKETVLGIANPGDILTGTIDSGVQSLGQNTVTFETSTGETKTATYQAIDCKGTTLACAIKQARCSWDALDNTTQYKVTVTNTDTGDLVKDGVVNHPTTSFVFPALPGKKYTCEVTAVNSCGDAEKAIGEGSCPLPTPTVLPSSTPVPSITKEVSVTQTNTITPSGIHPTNTPNPTNTPILTNTPLPTNTPVKPTGVLPSPPTSVAYRSPTPTTTAKTTSVAKLTPTSISALPETGLQQDILMITVLGSAIVIMGAFVIIFLW